MGRRRKPPPERQWDTNTELGPAAYIRGHLTGAWLGDPASLRAATTAAVCRALIAEGTPADSVETEWWESWADRFIGVNVTDGGVVFDFAQGEPDQPETALEVADS